MRAVGVRERFQRVVGKRPKLRVNKFQSIEKKSADAVRIALVRERIP